MPKDGFGQFLAQAGEFANPDDGLAADGAAHGLDGVSIRGREIEQKSLAMLAQRVDGVIHLQRRFRRQPGSEGKDALRLILLAAIHESVELIKQGAETVGLGLQLRDLGAQSRLTFSRANPRTHQ